MNNILYVVPTPIGNLKDISERSLEVLRESTVILCENTEVTGKLKSQYNLSARLVSLHKFNELSRIDEVIELVKDNVVSLVSDAGTPAISDPGQLLINSLIEHDIKIVPLPGPNAVVTALSASGIKFKSFTFVGFLEKEENKIVNTIDAHLNSDVIITFESPNRIKKTIEYIMNNYGDITIVIARELTKMYEEIITDKISNLLERDYKGEIVLLIPTSEIEKEESYVVHVEKLIELGLDNKDIIDYLVSTTNFKKNEIYNYLKERKNK